VGHIWATDDRILADNHGATAAPDVRFGLHATQGHSSDLARAAMSGRDRSSGATLCIAQRNPSAACPRAGRPPDAILDAHIVS
jgi:hypothetical protein